MAAREALNLEREREELLAAIADLDGRFEAGEIASEQYQQQREARKRRLRQIWNATQG